MNARYFGPIHTQSLRAVRVDLHSDSGESVIVDIRLVLELCSRRYPSSAETLQGHRPLACHRQHINRFDSLSTHSADFGSGFDTAYHGVCCDVEDDG
jgi:hypothetical protein